MTLKAISFSHSTLSFVLLLSCRNLLELSLLLSFPRICVWSTFGWSTLCYWLEGYTEDAVQVLLQRYNFVADAEKRKIDKSALWELVMVKKKETRTKTRMLFFQMFVFLFVSYSFVVFFVLFFLSHSFYIYFFLRTKKMSGWRFTSIDTSLSF